MTRLLSTKDNLAQTPGKLARAALWLPGLLVALGAAVATAHGLYEVARAAGAPPVIAGLYPLITDGLALVAYAATTRLQESGRGYAWTVVVLAAGLSGVAQASYLANGVTAAPAGLRFGIGAWPAIAAAIVAHLLFLIATVDRPTVHRPAAQSSPEQQLAGQATDIQAEIPTADEHPVATSVQTAPVPVASGGVRAISGRQSESPARDRAERTAQEYAAAYGELPTVTQLMQLSEVSRGTAGEALKPLRQQPLPLHLVTDDDPKEARS